MKPNLFLIGAPKSGTTSLSQYLGEHPRVCPSRVKEPHYFAEDFPSLRLIKKKKQYLELYSSTEKNSEYKYYLDASVWYMYSNRAVQNIFEFNPDAKILVLLRNPVTLLPSLHQQLLYTLDEDVPEFEKAWDLQESRRQNKNLPKHCRNSRLLNYKEVTNYAQQLNRVYSFFPRQQVKVIIFEHFIADTANYYTDILNFLGLEAQSKEQFEAYNSRKTFKNKFISKLVHRPPRIFKKTANLLKKVFEIDQLNILNKINALNQKPAKKFPLPGPMKRKIQSELEASVTELETLIDQDLSHWHINV